MKRISASVLSFASTFNFAPFLSFPTAHGPVFIHPFILLFPYLTLCAWLYITSFRSLSGIHSHYSSNFGCTSCFTSTFGVSIFMSLPDDEMQQVNSVFPFPLFSFSGSFCNLHLHSSSLPSPPISIHGSSYPSISPTLTSWPLFGFKQSSVAYDSRAVSAVIIIISPS